MVKNVTPKVAHEMIRDDGFRYLDVRSEQEFADGHAVGALNIPLLHQDPAGGFAPNSSFLEVVREVFGKEEKIVVACRSGGRSHQAASILMADGYSAVVNMDGGYSGRYSVFGQLEQPGWTDESLPVAESVDPDATYSALRERAKLE